MLMQEGNAARLEADTADVGLEAVLLEVSATIAQLADPKEGTELDAMPLSHAPRALVAQSLIRPVPRAVDGLLDSADVAGIEGRSGGCERVGDVAAKASIGVCPCEVAG
jgi:hypothetical protein